MLCNEDLKKGSVKCNSPLLPVYMPETGWILCCSKCRQSFDFIGTIDISEDVGKEISDAIIYYDDGDRFEEAASKFAYIESSIGNSKWKTSVRWHRILSQYGFVYDIDDVSWTICRPQLRKDMLRGFAEDRNAVLDTVPSSSSKIRQCIAAQLDSFKRTIDAILANRDYYDVFIDWDNQSSGIWAKELADKVKAALVEENIRAYTGEKSKDDHECGKRYAKGLTSPLMLAIIESHGITEDTRFFHEARVYNKNDSTRIIYCFHKNAQEHDMLPDFLGKASTELIFDDTKDDLDIFAHKVADEIAKELSSYKSAPVNSERIPEPPHILKRTDDLPVVDYDAMYHLMYQELNDYCSTHYKKPNHNSEWFGRLYQMWNVSNNHRIGMLMLFYLSLPEIDYLEGRKFYHILAQMFPTTEEVQRVLNNPTIKANLAL